MSMLVNRLDQRKVQIGFIGLGLMGSRLTQRLHAAGWRVQAWNRSPGPADAQRRAGVPVAASVAELVIHSDAILSSLANDEAVHSVYFGKDGAFSAAKRGTIILEMSTISPELSRLLHRQARTLGLSFLDLAVSGSTPAVEAGTITLLAGGDLKTFEQCAPIDETIAKQWFLIGIGSSGVLMKLVVNLRPVLRLCQDAVRGLPR
jgi:3-hydroxyisobutyrate dehydrogenase-like beta-hydroxyacid dehydrogenase